MSMLGVSGGGVGGADGEPPSKSANGSDFTSGGGVATGSGWVGVWSKTPPSRSVEAAGCCTGWAGGWLGPESNMPVRSSMPEL